MLSPKNKLADHYSAIYLLAAGYAAAAPTPLCPPLPMGEFRVEADTAPVQSIFGNMSGPDSDDARPAPVTHEAL